MQSPDSRHFAPFKKRKLENNIIFQNVFIFLSIEMMVREDWISNLCIHTMRSNNGIKSSEDIRDYFQIPLKQAYPGYIYKQLSEQ